MSEEGRLATPATWGMCFQACWWEGVGGRTYRGVVVCTSRVNRRADVCTAGTVLERGLATVNGSFS